MRLLLLLFTMSLPFVYQAQTGAQTIHTTTHDGKTREYILYIPLTYDGLTDVPLVINMHGYGSSMTEQIVYGDFRKIADTANFIIVVPNGLLDASNIQHWNYFDANGEDDTGFISMLIDEINSNYAVNTDRVYAAGMSNGGFMSIHLACHISNKIKWTDWYIYQEPKITFFLDDKIDTGAIILQKEVAIKKDETVGTLHDELQHLGSELVLDTLQLIETGTVKTTIQSKVEQPKTAYKLNKENCQIDWNESLDAIYNKIRGLNPFPAAWSYLKTNDDTLMVKLFEVDKEKIAHSEPIGMIISTKTELKVSVQGGYLIIKEMQLPGKRKMDIRSLLNGFNFSEDDKML